MRSRRTYDQFDEDRSPDFEDLVRDSGNLRHGNGDWRRILHEMNWEASPRDDDDDDDFEDDDDDIYDFDDDDDDDDDDFDDFDDDDEE